MDDVRPRPRLVAVEALAEPTPRTRAQLVRFFAWGYLSRRELNQHLKGTTPGIHHLRRRQPLHSAA